MVPTPTTIVHMGVLHQEGKDVVSYATEKYITIVPEIEMPGHTSAVLLPIQSMVAKIKNTKYRLPGEYLKIYSAPQKKLLAFRRCFK